MQIKRIDFYDNKAVGFSAQKISFSSHPQHKNITNITKDLFEKTLTEKEKMLAGKLYFAGDEQLRKDKAFAQDLWFRFNQLHPIERIQKKEIIKQLFGKTGERFWIEHGFKCDYGYNIEIGENFFANYNLVILDPAKVVFGNDVLVGPNCGFYTPEHPLNPFLRATGQQVAKPINVGNNVWFGGNVTVLGGANIGDNVVVGAGSVVTKDLPPNTLCLGTPCRAIKEIDVSNFDINEFKHLL